MKFSKEDAKRMMSSRVVITSPGKYENIKVTSCNDVVINNEDVTICNFSAVTPYQMEQIKEHLSSGDYDSAVNIQMSCRIWDDKYKPSNGETVNIIVEEITNKDGIEILVINKILPIAAKKATKLSFFNLFEDEDTAEELVVEKPMSRRTLVE